jgi:hypothetical protein
MPKPLQKQHYKAMYSQQSFYQYLNHLKHQPIINFNLQYMIYLMELYLKMFNYLCYFID